jgi:hypothetical protein
VTRDQRGHRSAMSLPIPGEPDEQPGNQGTKVSNNSLFLRDFVVKIRTRSGLLGPNPT